MIRMMVVDDEALLRRRLKKTIDWESLGIEVVGEAQNGQELIDSLVELEPEIVISDIRMPRVSGIDMLKTLHKMNSRTKVIFLSGYGEFEYAREALKWGAYDYLLKPINNEKIVSVIRKCIESIKEEKKQMKEAMLAYNESRLYCKIKRNRQLLAYLRERSGVWSEIQPYFTSEGTNGLSHCTCVVASFSLSHYEQDWGTDLMKFTISNVLSECYESIGQCITIEAEEDRVICLLLTEESGLVLGDLIEKGATRAKEVIRVLTDTPVTFGIGLTVNELSDIPNSYISSIQMHDLSIRFGIGQIYSYTNREQFTRRNFIDDAIDFLNDSYGKKITMAQVAEMYFFTPSYFSKVFKEETGKSFSRYLIELRIEKAKEMLASSQQRIYEIAEAVGYDDVQYFSRTFKDEVGMTPKKFQNYIKSI